MTETIEVALLCIFLIVSLLLSAKPASLSAQSDCNTSSSLGTISQDITVPVTATYSAWVRIWVPNGANSSARFSANTICSDLPASGNIATSSWVWVNTDASGSTMNTDLTGNTVYRVVISGQATGVRLDRVLFLSDNCTPTGTGENCTDITNPPTIDISQPTNGATVNGSVATQYNVSDESRASKVELLVDGATVANNAISPFDINWDSRTVSDGAHTLRARLTDNEGNTSQSSPITVNVTNDIGSGSVTSRIPIDAYKDGGEGVGYHDLSPGNNGDGDCRGDNVDLKAAAGGCILGWFETGEWLEYDITVGAAGSYQFRLRAASNLASGRQFHIEIDGNDISGVLTVPNTGSYDTFATVSKAVNLPAGQHALRLVSNQQYFDVAWMEFSGQSTVSLGEVITAPPANDVTSRLSADSYNSGGEGVGYHDDSAGNNGDGNCRSDDVDLKASAGGCVVGWFDTGEWLEYDVHISQAGKYILQINAARGESNNGGFRIDVDGKDSTGRVDVASTGNWDTFAVVNTPITLPEGDHIIRLYNVQQHFDVEWLQFVGPGVVQLTSVPPNPPPADANPPSQPANLRATNVTTSSASLLWDESVDSGVGVVGYAVYRDGILLQAVPSIGFNDSNLVSNSAYNYQVSALDGNGNESSKASLNIQTKAEQPATTGQSADLNDDGQFNSQDLALYKNLYKNSDLSADFDSNGLLDVRDWALFLHAWKEGR